MATTTLADLDLEPNWEDVIATHAAASLVDTLIQNVGSGTVAVVAGGAAAPDGKSGTILAPLDSVQVNAANVWVKSLEASGGRISVTTV